MIVMRFMHLLIPRAAITEIVPFQDAGIFEQPDSAVHGGDRDVRIDGGRPAVEFLRIRVIRRF
jgi:hypothetical protein